MVEAAAVDWPGLEPSRLEIDRGGPSYTIDTVRALRQVEPDADLTLVVGSDVVAGLTTWKEEPALRDLVTLAVVGRPGVPTVDPPAGWRAGRGPGGHVRRVEYRATSPARTGRTGGRSGPRGGDPLHGRPWSVRYGEMIVRTTQKESGTPPDSAPPLPGPPPRLDQRSAAVVVGPEPAGPPGGRGAEAPGSTPGPTPRTPEAAPTSPPASRVVDRKAQRAARRQRRRLAIACAVVVAVCLALTILIVDMARTRTSGSQTGLSLPAWTTSGAHTVSFLPTPSLESRDAPASQGGNR